MMKSLTLLLVLFYAWNASATAQQNPDSTADLNTEIGQMLLAGFRGLKAGPSSQIAKDIRKYHVGSVVLFDYDVPAHSHVRNIKSPQQLRHLTRQLQSYSNTPLLIATDQEGGEVDRLKQKYGFPPTVSAQYLGKINNADTTRKYARMTARTLKKEGINLNLAPVVDVNVNPDNPVIGKLHRSFSADPAIVTRQARIYIKELHKYGILTTLKHFPGHGSSRSDSHKGFVDVTHTWKPYELQPYRKLIAAGLPDVIMTAHIFNARLDSTYPATLSKPTITGLLRDSLNYHGVVMSDDMQMGAIRNYYGLKKALKHAILAGDDILLFGNNTIYQPHIIGKAFHIIRHLVKTGAIPRKRIDESYQRIMALKQRLPGNK